MAIDTLQNCILRLFGSDAEDSFETITHRNYTTAFRRKRDAPSSSTTYSVRLDNEYDGEEAFVLDGEIPIRRAELEANPLTSPSRIIISARGFDIPESIIPARDIIHRHKYTDRLLLAVNLWLEVSRVYARNGLIDDAQSAVDQAKCLNELDCNVHAEYAMQAQEALQYGLAERFWQIAQSLDEESELVRMGYARMMLDGIYADEEAKKRNIDTQLRRKKLQLVKSLLCHEHDHQSCMDLRIKTDILAERFRAPDLMIGNDEASKKLFSMWAVLLKGLKPVRCIRDTVPLF